MWTVGLIQPLVKVVRINPPMHHPHSLEALGYTQWEEEMWSSDVWTYSTVAIPQEVPLLSVYKWRCSPVNQKGLSQKWELGCYPTSKLLIDQNKSSDFQTLRNCREFKLSHSEGSFLSEFSLHSCLRKAQSPPTHNPEARGHTGQKGIQRG